MQKATFHLAEKVKLRGPKSQILLAMKLTAILLTIATLQISARTYSQTVTFQGKEVTLEKIFREIKMQTNYVVICNAAIFDKAKPVNVNAKDVPLRSFLDEVLQGQQLSYNIENTTIFISEKATPIENAPSLIPQPPGIDVHGRVVNEDGEPVAGASVYVKGDKTKGTTTDGNGYFTLTGVDEHATLVFSGANIETFEKKVNGKTELGTLAATNKVESGEEVVINKGYYDEKKELSAGDVGIVTSKIIEEQPVSDPIEALQGRIAGLNIQQTSGIPGAYDRIQIRGQNSIANGNDPLYIIDGVPFSSVSLSTTYYSSPFGSPGATSNNFPNNTSGTGMSPFNALNPSDIESIEV
ncbi:MAG: TonB-dependent receptor plug domain-containing protein, partial [Bacteroidota bacterium]|nr:TonB-dependent receptor plug domain-containing protein [Bacteroidota bacterium]